MKSHLVALSLFIFAGSISAGPTDSCSGLSGPALDRCLAEQQSLLRQQLAQQLQQLTQQQDQLAQQQKQLGQQQQQLMQQQEQLAQQQRDFAQQRHQQEQERQEQQQQLKAIEVKRSEQHMSPEGRAAGPAASQESTRRELASWKAENPWFGSDYARTDLAMRYAKQLQHDRPDLTGRPFLEALSAKVRDTFGH